jgi:hypothetical protein
MIAHASNGETQTSGFITPAGNGRLLAYLGNIIILAMK